MIDMLVLNIPFKDEYCVEVYNKKHDRHNYVVPIRSLPVTLSAKECTILANGELNVGRLSTNFESLPSSYSNMAMKVYNDGLNSDAYVCIKCSPSKLLQGHNVYGINCFKKAARNMLAILAVSNSRLYSMLDIRFTEVSEFDLTYSTQLANEKTKMLVLDHLSRTSGGQTKNRGSNYATTVYWGAKNSRLKRLKAYSKYEEVENDISNLDPKKDGHKIEILESIKNTEFCKNALRFEATLKKRYLQRMGIPINLFSFLQYVEQNTDFNNVMWKTAFKDVFKSLGGQTIKMINDDNIFAAIRKTHSSYNSKGVENLTKVNRIYSNYQVMKSLGYQHMKAITSDRTFYRYVKELKESGFSQSFLQNLNSETGSIVVPVLHLVEIDFSKQHPKDYLQPEDLKLFGDKVSYIAA